MKLTFDFKVRTTSASRIQDAKQIALEKIANVLFEELFHLSSQKGITKSGNLRQALRVEIIDGEINAYFDTTVAPYAPFVLSGTKFIKGQDIIQTALDNIREHPEYLSAIKELVRKCI